ncbi:MAG: LytTR family transcriptional regulator [Bacteroidales bacterium]|nr:LytTR family transcriptional regulator [Bacteroidales bacterium]
MTINNKIPGYLLGKYQLIGTVTFSVLFAIVYLNIAIPFSDTAWFALGDSALFLMTLAYITIAIITLVVSRVLMYKSKQVIEHTYVSYILWCVIEILMICGLYTWLTIEATGVPQNDAINIFQRALKFASIALGIPYLISGMYFAIIDKNNTIRLMNYENVVTDEPAKPDTSMQKITLFDNSGALKLSLNLENLYYIESDDNYIKVWYTDNKGEIKQYMLRCRLKTVEESFKGSGLVRCNRKYVVNINKVKVLRKESEGYVLEIDNEAIPPLPVTKTYTDTVLSHFTETQPLLEPMDD